MGPTIILDKSAFQSISWHDIIELDHYFSVVIPPVLILEILADLKKPKSTIKKAKATVMQLSNKIQPVGYVNVDFRLLCTDDLLGGHITMDRRPIVAGGRKVKIDGGGFGIHFDVQPENEALMRWSAGLYDEAEQLLAEKWRKVAHGIDLESFKRRMHNQFKSISLRTLKDVHRAINHLVDIDDFQDVLLKTILQEPWLIPELREWTERRWSRCSDKRLQEFAPYALYCARMIIIFQLALVKNIIGTRATNRIDLEYLFYAPFAHIFCSGDKFHRDLAKVTLDNDQSFVWHDDLRQELRILSDARRKFIETDSDEIYSFQPKSDSLIPRLWKKHFGSWSGVPLASRGPSEEESKRILEKLKPMEEAIKKAKSTWPPRPKWPCP